MPPSAVKRNHDLDRLNVSSSTLYPGHASMTSAGLEHLSDAMEQDRGDRHEEHRQEHSCQLT
jgi:hypothetical protein